MTATVHARNERVRSGVLMLLGVIVSGLVVVTAGGCTAASSHKAMTSNASAKPSKAMMMASGSDTNPSVPPCYECSGKGKPPLVEGAATVELGTQVVNIKIENGYYTPNRITLKAGMPIQVVFTGKAKDCVGKPKFGSLDKQVDIRKSGKGTIALGTLSPGTYAFTCGMGASAGSITVQ